MSRTAFWLALAVSSLAVAIGIRFSTFVAWGTDPAAYIEAAERWAGGGPITPSPIQFWSPWAPNDTALAAFGFRRGVVRGTEVGEYPLGLPVIMAAAIRIGGPLAAYLVVPICAGLLVWSLYLVGAALAGPWSGLIATMLVAASPITSTYAVQPMSDVPAAAFWALAWAMCLRPGLGASAAAGAAAAAAIMIRPNQVPFALILAVLVWAAPTTDALRRGQRLVVFGCAAAIGPAMVVWSQTALYGTPFRPGYVGGSDFYRLEYIVPSLTLYPRLLMFVHTPLLFTGLIACAALVIPRVRARLDQGAPAVALTATAFVVMNYALYLPYLPLDDVFSVRYVLPAMMALCVLLAGFTIHAARALRAVSPWLAALALVPALIAGVYPAGLWRFVEGIRHEQVKALLAGRYLREALPANAAVLAKTHITPMMHYTDRLVVRLDSIGPGALDGIIAELQRRGYHPVFVLDAGDERTWFSTHFASSQFHALEWPARAEFIDRLGRVIYVDPADRDGYGNGQRWPTDLVRAADRPQMTQI